MFEIKGKYATARVFADHVEDEAMAQIYNLLNQPFVEDSSIAIMPDVHAGKGCTIGFTQTIADKVCPNLVGVDISCGMLWVNLGKVDIDLERFDSAVHEAVPCGDCVHDSPTLDEDFFKRLHCHSALNMMNRLTCSCGSLGGGNHFVELDKDDDGNVYLVIHSGSRNLGLQVANYYQNKAVDECNYRKTELAERKKTLIATLKKEHREKEIQNSLALLTKDFEQNVHRVPDDLAWLEGDNMENYLDDMAICAEFASRSRHLMCENILKAYYGSVPKLETRETLHNYIDLDRKILRKGSISLNNSELALIPINMRDGSLIVKGKGNPDYNYSGPHGAGRLLSRSKAKETLDMSDYEDAMKGIYTSCVVPSTIDESPMAYKNMDEILANIEDTATVVKVIRPIYNFKAI